ncbi:unnamed protein product [Oncorhynchus mykiss]|uniref:Ig-like domain-containing protein n=1 Tax=Oncorhynchus mykiss TaxID=8022 RepID=A0A060WJH5_ONCMY|nr:unnamed protein product [Oncorhynchus mykiss]
MAPLSFTQAPALSSVRMAAILDDQSVCGRGERLALALARENINSIFEGQSRARVEVDIFELQKDSQYDTTDTMCQILPKGVVSVIGPASSPASGSTVSHICGEKEIPHVKVGPEETPKLPYLRFASVSLYPSNEDLSLAIGAILRSFSYPTASLICAKAECLLRLEELVRRFLISRETLSVRMLDESLDPTPLLKEIRDDKVATIIIDANASISYLILRKASELGMTSAFYKYILTTMDFPLLRLDDVVDDQSNIVGFSMLNSSHPFYLEFIRSLNLSWREGCDLSPYPGPSVRTGILVCGFIHVLFVTCILSTMITYTDIVLYMLYYNSVMTSSSTFSLMHLHLCVEYDGLTGRVEFNSKGQRTNYTLRILEKHRGGHKEIGIWYSNNTLAMNSTSLDINMSETLANKTLIVTTILENPYVMHKSNYQELRGNDRYQGFCVDMLRELSDLLKFSFRIKLVDDGLYGAPEPNGSWTGMVGELINRKADLAVAGFTITSEREKVIDFSKPFMSLGISILYRVHLGRKPGYFSFLDPFSPAVWLFMLLAYLAVSCVLFLAARLSPYEWYNSHPCPMGRKDMLENQYTLGNSLWFPVGGFMQQGSEIMPRALSTRCVSGVCYCSSDQADGSHILMGIILCRSITPNLTTSHSSFLLDTNEAYFWTRQPSVFVKSTEEGIARVVNSKYAFLLESTMNKYHRRLNCNLTQIGGLLDTKGYGIGMPLGSPFKEEITLGVLQLAENNRLEILKRRWWEGGQCPKEEDHRAKGGSVLIQFVKATGSPHYSLSQEGFQTSGMDLFNFRSLVILLSAVGCCNGQSVLPAGPLQGVQGKNVTFKTLIMPTDVGDFITVSWNFNGGSGLVPVVTSAPKGETVGAGYAGRVSLNSSTGVLKLGPLTAKDSGDYAVTMVTSAAVQRTGVTALKVLEPVAVVTIKSNLNEAVEFNSTVVLTCSAKGSFLMYKWLNGTAPLVADGNHVTLSANATVLTVAGVFREDLVGPIYCTVSNKLESDSSAPFNLTVSYGPENIAMAVTPMAEVQKKGSNITLTCSAQSSPAAVIQWIHNGVPLNVMGPKLVLANIAEAQSGNYSCMASNAKTLRYLESTTAKFTVVEALSGTKITGPNGTLVAGNSTATLSCQARAGTAGTRVWLKNGVALSPSNRVVVSADKSCVTIKPVQKEDSGEYQCKLTNAVNTDSASLKIGVNFGPEAVSVKGDSAVEVKDRVTLKCTSVSLPAATYTWKFNGTLTDVMTAEYIIEAAVYKNTGIYTCEASNAVTGLSTAVAHQLSVKGLIVEEYSTIRHHGS